MPKSKRTGKVDLSAGTSPIASPRCLDSDELGQVPVGGQHSELMI